MCSHPEQLPLFVEDEPLIVLQDQRADDEFSVVSAITPRLAAPLPEEDPRIKLVYSWQKFANVPLPERVSDYPELRYMVPSIGCFPGFTVSCGPLNLRPPRIRSLGAVV